MRFGLRSLGALPSLKEFTEKDLDFEKFKQLKEKGSDNHGEIGGSPQKD